MRRPTFESTDPYVAELLLGALLGAVLFAATVTTRPRVQTDARTALVRASLPTR